MRRRKRTESTDPHHGPRRKKTNRKRKERRKRKRRKRKRMPRRKRKRQKSESAASATRHHLPHRLQTATNARRPKIERLIKSIDPLRGTRRRREGRIMRRTERSRPRHGANRRGRIDQ